MIIQFLSIAEELGRWRCYVIKDRFVGYAKAKYGYNERKADALFGVWDKIVSLNHWKLKDVDEDVLNRAVDIARCVYDAVCKGGHISVVSNNPRTARWRVYYKENEDTELLQMDINLLDKDDVIKYSLLLQREGVEIINRVDFYDRTEVRCDSADYKKGQKIDIYDGDIIFCTDSDSSLFNDSSGCYVCLDGCYKKLLYTPCRGYVRRGELDIEQYDNGDDYRYNDHAFNAYDCKFKIVGNIYIDKSILKEVKTDTAESE